MVDPRSDQIDAGRLGVTRPHAASGGGGLQHQAGGGDDDAQATRGQAHVLQVQGGDMQRLQMQQQQEQKMRERAQRELEFAQQQAQAKQQQQQPQQQQQQKQQQLQSPPPQQRQQQQQQGHQPGGDKEPHEPLEQLGGGIGLHTAAPRKPFNSSGGSGSGGAAPRERGAKGKALPRPHCADRQPAKQCSQWLDKGECDTNPGGCKLGSNQRARGKCHISHATL